MYLSSEEGHLCRLLQAKVLGLTLGELSVLGIYRDMTIESQNSLKNRCGHC
jgi:hypothetical protein